MKRVSHSGVGRKATLIDKNMKSNRGLKEYDVSGRGLAYWSDECGGASVGKNKKVGQSQMVSYLKCSAKGLDIVQNAWATTGRFQAVK